MEQKKNWKDFQSLMDTRSDYRRWLYCDDPEEKALWKELLTWENMISGWASQIQRTPMPTEMGDKLFTRSALHIDQRVAIAGFLELLFENCLRKKDEENLNLLFSFLETYSGLLEQEAKWCQT